MPVLALPPSAKKNFAMTQSRCGVFQIPMCLLRIRVDAWSSPRLNQRIMEMKITESE
jgi:hypothetical protein